MGSGEKSRTHTLPSAAFSNSALVPKLQAPLGFFQVWILTEPTVLEASLWPSLAQTLSLAVLRFFFNYTILEKKSL